MLAPEQLRSLLKDGGYGEIRVRCFKPWHQRTVDVVVFGDEAINDFVAEATKKVGFCSQVRFLPDDNSLTQNDFGCSEIWMRNIENYWDHFIYVKSMVHIVLVEFGGRFECDDKFDNVGFKKKGNWLFYVR